MLERLAGLLDGGDAVLGAAGALGDDADDLLGLVLDLGDEAARSRAWRVEDSSASLRTSSATTAKPLPCSPARAASIAALSASRLVCSASAAIVVTMPPICSEREESSRIAASTCAEDSRDLADRLGGIDRRGDALLGDAAGLQRRFGRLAGGLGARVGGTSGLLEPGTHRFDHPHLALGALGDVADRVGDLGDGAAGLLGGRGICCEAADTLPAPRETSPITSASSARMSL